MVIRDLAAHAARLFLAERASESFGIDDELERTPLTIEVPRSAAFCEAEE